MIPVADTPSLGMLIGLPIAALVFLACVAFAAAFAVEREWFPVSGGVAAALAVLLVTGIAMWPWKHDFHFYVTKTGTVEKIGKRLISDGDKGMSQRFVVTLNGVPYGVDDTRASLLKVGDRVVLKCKREFDFGSNYYGWACKWGQS